MPNPARGQQRLAGRGVVVEAGGGGILNIDVAAAAGAGRVVAEAFRPVLIQNGGTLAVAA